MLPLWADGILIVILALLFDRFVGDPPNSIHPLRWMGNLLDAINRHIKNRTSRWTSVLGFLSYLLVLIIFSGVSLAITSLMRIGVSHYNEVLGEVLWIVLTAFFVKITFSVYLFRKFCRPICDDLRAGRIDDADDKMQMLVSRDTKGMDAEHVSSSCCETISENLVDSVYSPVFYFGLLGLFGAIVFRCANLMDAMWGYLNEKYARLGYFPAKFDDVLGFVTARLSPYFIALAGMLLKMDWRAAVPAAKAEHGKTPSPNSGWSMTAMAAVLGIRMEKKDVYVMGNGEMPTVEDVDRCIKLYEISSALFVLTLGLILFSVIGIYVQVLMENSIFGFWGDLL